MSFRNGILPGQLDLLCAAINLQWTISLVQSTYSKFSTLWAQPAVSCHMKKCRIWSKEAECKISAQYPRDSGPKLLAPLPHGKASLLGMTWGRDCWASVHHEVGRCGPLLALGEPLTEQRGRRLVWTLDRRILLSLWLHEVPQNHPWAHCSYHLAATQSSSWWPSDKDKPCYSRLLFCS